MSDDTREEKGDEMADRLSSRFEKTENPDQPAQTDPPANLDNPATQDGPDMGDSPDDPDETDTLADLDPKEAWPGRNIRVPDGTAGTTDLLQAFDGEFQRFQYECDWKVLKQKHYYPVLIVKGTEQLEEMDGEAFTECVDALDLR